MKEKIDKVEQCFIILYFTLLFFIVMQVICNICQEDTMRDMQEQLLELNQRLG